MKLIKSSSVGIKSADYRAMRNAGLARRRSSHKRRVGYKVSRCSKAVKILPENFVDHVIKSHNI